MCRACGKRHNSVVEIDTSPRGGGQDAGSLESINSASFGQGGWQLPGMGAGGPGSAGMMDLVPPSSRGSGLTMKEYDQHLARLNKENFALKLRIYFMEEQQGHVSQNAPQIYNNNIELKVENESLKRQLYDKHQLLSQASDAMNQMEEDFKEQVNALLSEQEEKAKELDENALQMQKTLEAYAARCAQLEEALEKPELTQLCDLAFPPDPLMPTELPGQGVINKQQWVTDAKNVSSTTADSRRQSTSSTKEGEVERKFSGGSSDGGRGSPNSPLHIKTTNITNNNINNTLPNTSNNLQQMQYQHCPPHAGTKEYPDYFQYQQYSQETGPQNTTGSQATSAPNVVVVPVPTGYQGPEVPPVPMLPAPSGFDGNSSEIIRMLQAEIGSLQDRLQKLQNDLGSKEQQLTSLHANNDILRKELQDKEKDVVEREGKVKALSQELETKLQQIQCRDDTITNLHSNLNKVEPEISVKVQEIVERDRIIEEKIEQIEQQNKILVEIQITLDEKQKQIAELETSLAEAKGKVEQLEKDYNKSCQAINILVGEKDARDKEISTLKKEIKRRDRKIKDLVAELKETLDSLAKAKWEAETGGGGNEDSVKEMVEEENERLWAEVEQKKLEMQNLLSELTKAGEEKAAVSEELKQCQATLSEREEALRNFSAQATEIEGNVRVIESLRTELGAIKDKLEGKEEELKELKEAQCCSSDELNQLKLKLEKCEAEKQQEVEMLKSQLELKKKDILKLQSQSDGTESKTCVADATPAQQCSAAELSRRNNMTPLHVNINTGLPNQVSTITYEPAAEIQSDKENDVDKPCVSSFVKQIENLRQDLQNTKTSIGNQMNELGGSKKTYRDIIRKYRSEILRIRKKLSESNNACEMLRVRLEELADFLEQILELEDNGVIDMSKLSGINRNQLYKTLNDSRQLSQSFSMSAFLDLESEFDEDEFEAHQHDVTDCSVLPDSSSAFYLNDQTNASCLGESLLDITKLSEGLATSSEHQVLIAKLCSEVELKARQLDDILGQVARMSESMETRENKLLHQRQLIEKLEAQLNADNRACDAVSVNSQTKACDVASVECQTLLAMAPCQSHVETLAELSTPYVSSCSENLSQIKEGVAIGECGSKLVPLTTQKETVGNRVHALKLVGGYASASEVLQTPARIPASPSESEAWSEPDRNVSLARIGLETCTLAASLDRSLSRSRQTRTSGALSSESDTEECPMPCIDENSSAMLMPPSSNISLSLQPVGGGCPLKPVPKRRSDASEVRRLATKLRALEHLNETLKAELNIYQSLSHQLSPTTDQQQSDSRSSLHSFGDLPELPLPIEAPSSSGSRVSSIPLTLKKMRFGGVEDNLALAAPLLQEIRSLRTKLEESINNNDQLRDQLEAAVLSCTRATDDPSHLTHLTTALLNAQETLQLMREKLAFAQRCEQVQADRCAMAEKRTEEDVKLCENLKAQLTNCQNKFAAAQESIENLKKKSDELQAKYNDADEQLVEAKRLHENSEACLQERLNEVRRACEESEARLKAQHEVINEMFNSLQESPSQWNHVSHLHSALQASETQVLRVTRDRLVLLGEKTKLQAQLMSAQAQTCLLQDSLCEEEQTCISRSEHPGVVDRLSLNKSKEGATNLPNQLAKVQAAVKNLQAQCSRLQADNTSLIQQRDQLHEKLSGYKAVEKLSSKPDITLESVVTSDKGDGSLISSTVALNQMQRNHSLLQDDYTHLQKLFNQLQESEKNICRQLQASKKALQKSEASIASLAQQYQEHLQQAQSESAERLIEAEKKISEAQARAQERVQLSTEKLNEMQKTYEQKLSQLKGMFEQENRRKDEMLREMESKLVSEKDATHELQAELSVLKNKMRQESDSTVWKENKENLPGKQLSFNEMSTSPRSLHHNPSSSVVLRTSNNHTTTSPRSPYSRSSLPRSPLVPGPSQDLHASPRALHFSEPCAVGMPYYGSATEDEDLHRSSYSPDLGLGSSDNGASSLERVMMERAIPVLVTERASLPMELTQKSPGLCTVPGHSGLVKSNASLLSEVEHLQKLLSTKNSKLAETMQQLEAANARKQTVEKAIYRQLNKTHQVLKKAKGNLQQQQRSESEKTESSGSLNK